MKYDMVKCHDFRFLENHTPLMYVLPDSALVGIQAFPLFIKSSMFIISGFPKRTHLHIAFSWIVRQVPLLDVIGYAELLLNQGANKGYSFFMEYCYAIILFFYPFSNLFSQI